MTKRVSRSKVQQLLYDPNRRIPGILRALQGQVWPKVGTDAARYKLVQRYRGDASNTTFSSISDLVRDIDIHFPRSHFGRLLSTAALCLPVSGPLHPDDAIIVLECYVSTGDLVAAGEFARSQLFHALIAGNEAASTWFVQLLRILLYLGLRDEAIRMNAEVIAVAADQWLLSEPQIRHDHAVVMSTLESQTTISQFSPASVQRAMVILDAGSKQDSAKKVLREVTNFARLRAAQLLRRRVRNQWAPLHGRDDQVAAGGRERMTQWFIRLRDFGFDVSPPRTWSVEHLPRALGSMLEVDPLLAFRLHEAASYVFPDVLRSAREERHQLLIELLDRPFAATERSITIGYQAVCTRCVALSHTIHASGAESARCWNTRLRDLAAQRGQLVELAWSEEIAKFISNTE